MIECEVVPDETFFTVGLRRSWKLFGSLMHLSPAAKSEDPPLAEPECHSVNPASLDFRIAGVTNRKLAREPESIVVS